MSKGVGEGVSVCGFGLKRFPYLSFISGPVPSNTAIQPVPHTPPNRSPRTCWIPQNRRFSGWFLPHQHNSAFRHSSTSHIATSPAPLNSPSDEQTPHAVAVYCASISTEATAAATILLLEKTTFVTEYERRRDILHDGRAERSKAQPYRRSWYEV